MELIHKRDRHEQSGSQPERRGLARRSTARQKHVQRPRQRMRADGAVYRDLYRQRLEQRQGTGEQTEHKKSGDVRPTRTRLPHQPAAENPVAISGEGHPRFLSLYPALVSEWCTAEAAPMQSRDNQPPRTAAAAPSNTAAHRAPSNAAS